VSTTLIIDSVHSQLTVGLLSNGHIVWKSHNEQKQHDKNINRIINELVASHSEIDAYAIVTGPGSWTGCRVGVAAVKGFCFGNNKPVFALNSLDALGEKSAIKSHANIYFVKENGKYLSKELQNTEGYNTMENTPEYRDNLLKQLVNPITAKELEPFYITEFQVKT